MNGSVRPDAVVDERLLSDILNLPCEGVGTVSPFGAGLSFRNVTRHRSQNVSMPWIPIACSGARECSDLFIEALS